MDARLRKGGSKGTRLITSTRALVRLRLPWSIGLIVFSVEVVRLSFLLMLSERALVEHLPDDSFYYLVLAKNFALHGRWTFDGVAPATGFHLLWAYLLSAFYFFHPMLTFKQAVAVAGVVEITCLAIAAALTTVVTVRLWGERAALGVLFVFLSAASLRESMQLMETSLLILVAAAYLTFALRDGASFTATNAAAILSLGVAGTLARSDFGLLPFWIFIAYVLLYSKKQCGVAGLKLAAFGLLGSVIGTAVVASHSYLISGHLMQSSAEVKVHWTRIKGLSIRPALYVFYSFFNPVSGVSGPSPNPFPIWGLKLGSGIRLLLIFGLAIGLLIGIRRERRMPVRVITVALAADIVSYLALYRFSSSAVNSWYVANFQIPVAILCGAALSVIAPKLLKPTLAAVGSWSVLGLLFSLRPAYPYNVEMYVSGHYLREHHEIQPVGSWNTGMLAYFSERSVKNLDGLVNDQIIPYLLTGTLADYFITQQIEYVLDNSEVFGEPAALGGGVPRWSAEKLCRPKS
jgi:hypothetical protein